MLAEFSAPTVAHPATLAECHKSPFSTKKRKKTEISLDLPSQTISAVQRRDIPHFRPLAPHESPLPSDHAGHVALPTLAASS